MSLTTQSVERAKPPALGPNGAHTQKFVADNRVPGFALRVTDQGTKSFVLQARINGKLKRISIGRFPEWSVVQARDRALELRSEIAHGVDPTVKRDAERERARTAPTFGDLASRYLANAKARQCRSLARMKERVETHLKLWTNRKAADITREDCRELHDRIANERGRSLANRVLDLIKSIFNSAIDADAFDSANPALRIKHFKEQKRARFLSADEWKRISAALQLEPDERFRAYFPLLLMLGARKSELLTARWEHIDLVNGTWQKPVTKTVPQLLPLPRPAIAIFESLSSRGKSVWLFPSYGATGHLSSGVDAAWRRIRERAGVVDLHVHDLRHSLASFMMAQGFDLGIIGKVLNHTNPSTTQRYAHLAMEPQRLALEATAAAIAAAGR